MAGVQRKNSLRIPPFFRRLFKFTSMDFETVSYLRPSASANVHILMHWMKAVWEMTHLIIAPKKVFRNIYYHVKALL
jgi:hypothetical protein